MLKDILDAIKRREEEVTFLGKEFIVRELGVSDGVAPSSMTKEEVQANQWWLIFVRCIFEKGTGMQVFQDDDIAELKTGSRVKLAPLLGAVNRVNGLDEDDNAKNSSAQV